MVLRCLALAFAITLTAALLVQGEDDAVSAEPKQPQTDELSAFIDGEILKVLKRDEIKPAALATDEVFLRRVYLDTVGVPPTRAEVDAYLKDDKPSKRERLIDSLIDDPRFGQHLADLWMPILRERGNDLEALGTAAGDVMAVWLAREFNQDTGFDEIITQLVTAEGKISDNPAAAYYGLMGFPGRSPNMAGLTTKHFAGIQIQCAECHDHPYEDSWTQETFVGMASFFTGIEVNADFYVQPVDPRIETKPMPPRKMIEEYAKSTDVPPEYRVRLEDILTYDKPQLIDDSAVKTKDTMLWRKLFATWITDDDNDIAMQAQVNRFWSFLFGIGLLNPIDDFNSLNDASHPELLAGLGKWYAANGYSVKKLYRAILNSNTYQRAGANAEGAELWHFASAPVRQMTPEQFFGALFQLRDGDSLLKSFGRKNINAYEQLKQFKTFRDMQKDNGEEMGDEGYNLDEKLLKKYLSYFDEMGDEWKLRRGLAAQYSALSQNDEKTVSETFTLSIDQALTILNGEVTRRLSDSRNGSLIYAIMREFKSTEARIEGMYMSILSRKPTAVEEARMLKYLKTLEKEGTPEQLGLEDIFYALVSTTEFATNH